MTNNIAVIGECMVELQRVELQKSGQLYRQGFGGDTLNTAIYLARLIDKLDKISYVTGLGIDEFSNSMLQAWESEGIDTRLVYRLSDKLPGLYTIETAENGERSFRYWRNDSAARYWLQTVTENDLFQALKSYNWIYLSGISLAILPDNLREKLFTVLAECKKCGCNIVFDNNYRAILWQNQTQAQTAYRRILQLTTIAFLTFEDEVMLYGDQHEEQAIDRTLALGVAEIVIKRGAEACIVVTPNSQEQLEPMKVERIIDTTAAGDSFSAGYLAKRLNGGSILQAIKSGHQIAGNVIQHKGAIIAKEDMPPL